jgi:hypothetical protein
VGTGLLTGGVARFGTASLAIDTYSVTAIYGGNSSFTTSTSIVLKQVVNLG